MRDLRVSPPTPPLWQVDPDTGRGTFWVGDGWEWLDYSTRYGWRPLASWGRDGWDLGDWPLVCVNTRTDRTTDGTTLYGWCTYTEGDLQVTWHPTRSEREHALDGWALWWWQHYGPDTIRDRLHDVNDIDQMPPDLRGPYRDRERGEASLMMVLAALTIGALILPALAGFLVALLRVGTIVERKGDHERSLAAAVALVGSYSTPSCISENWQPALALWDPPGDGWVATVAADGSTPGLCLLTVSVTRPDGQARTAQVVRP